MNILHKKVVGERIKEAREIRGYSQTTLAELIQKQRASVSAYEKEKVQPSSEVLFQIATITDFPISFFFKQYPHETADKSFLTFRQFSTATKTSRIQGERYADLLYDIFTYLNNYLEFKKPNIPVFEIEYDTLTYDEIEQIAIQVRYHWGMKAGPIANLVDFFENNGILISSISLKHKLDAFSLWCDKTQPIIITCDNNKTSVRRRFSMAHELGHLVLHMLVPEDDYAQKKKYALIEDQANYFAGAFLLPASSFLNEYFSSSMHALVQLKERWKVSIAAITMRLHKLNVLSERRYFDIFRELNTLPGGKRNEPLDDKIMLEKPTLLKSAVNILIDNKTLTPKHIIEDMAISETDFTELTGIAENFFLNENEHTFITNFNLRRL